ncbi:SusC/RagA family TonB-linked outer membrane protein [Lewinella sp. IMCC34191]|uniref:SusC/RagA family TonB-linked outer membrane protein n=1 Tax=Lewinella sp. IMCC34191 TaxID=2259172 RepID=UPI000E288349|nr:TonB-dependent receptor [Lewinella sp. IMCC34191]
MLKYTAYRLLGTAGIALLSLLASAQITVSGTVVDDTDQTPLIGVTVMEAGTTQGTVTDLNGRYELTVGDPDAALRFSYTGYASQEIPVNNQSVIDLQMASAASQLDEVVVIGYGEERRRRDLTGSISTVAAQEIERVPFASAEYALQGNTTGVRVINSSGNPSDPPSIFVRGIGTFNGDAQPLYVIDGQIINPPSAGNQDLIGNLNLWTLVNPNDIASISVLKDASAAAIYGSRGANGVILITTKTGKRGRPVVELNVQNTISNIPQHDLLGPTDYLNYVRELYTNSANPDVSIEDELYGRTEENEGARLNNFNPQLDPQSAYYIGDNATFYDWQDAVTVDNALTQNYNLKVSGASESADYYVSLAFFDQESNIFGSDLRRYNLTTNLNTSISDFLRVGMTYRGVFQRTFAESSGSDLFTAANTAPWQPISDPANRFGYALPFDNYYGGSEWNQVRQYGLLTRTNVFAVEAINDSRYELQRNAGSGYVEVIPLTGLSIRGSLNVDYVYQSRQQFRSTEAFPFTINAENPATLGGGGSLGSLNYRDNRFINFQIDLTGTYDRTFGKHTVNLLAGIQDQFYKNPFLDIGTDFLTTNDFRRVSIPDNRERVSGFSGQQQKFWYGYVARAGYNYAYKYYLDLSFRRDASSGFPDENRWGNFYAVSGAWRISSEPFMQGLEWLSDLKIRGGWGQAGNDEAVVGNYAYLSRVAGTGSYAFGSGNGDPTGNYKDAVTINDLPNRDLTWETVTTSYIGFDAALFENRVNATVELYDRTTEDILQFVNLPPTVGVSSPAYNIGSVQNRGLDLQLGYTQRVGQLELGVSGNVSFVQNKVLELYDGQPLSTGGYGRVEEGRSIGHIWGYKLGGMFQSDQEVTDFYTNLPDNNVGDASFVGPGDLYFLDIGGNPDPENPNEYYSTDPDGQINSYDQTEIGNTIPGYTYGLNLNAKLKNFDLNMSFYGEGNVDRINEFYRTYGTTSAINPRSTLVLDRWTPSNTNTNVPRAIIGDPAGNNRLSDRFVESAAFFRLNTWQLGYSLPASITGNTEFISNFRIYVGGQNNIYLTNWSGIDPVNDLYPLPRGFFAGLSAKF